MSAPTVLTVVGGATRTPSRSFSPGNLVSVFSVGAEADWVIVAPGVERVHLYLGFDGRAVQVAPAAPATRVFLDGRELGAGWHVAPVGCELRFGAVCLLVTNEALRGGTQPLLPLSAPGQAAPPGAERPAIVGFAPVQPAPRVQGPWGPPAVQPAGGGALPDLGRRLESTAVWHTPPGAMEALRAASAQVESHEKQAPAPANVAKIQPAPMVPLGRVDRTLASPHALAQGTLSPTVQVFAPDPPPMPMLAPAEAPPPAPGAPGAAWSNASAAEGDPLGPITIADGGALRAHAERVAAATPSAAFTSAQAYAADVRRVAGPAPVPAAGRPAAASNVRARPDEVRTPAPGPAPEAPRVATRFSLRSSWREASVAKKLTLVLLPFAVIGVALIFDEDPAPAPIRVKQVAIATASPSALAASSPSALAASSPSAVPASSPSAVPASSALAPRASGSSPTTVLSVARPSASAPPLAPPATSVAGSVIEVGSAAASSAAAPRPSYAAAERDAINAAFEGRNVEAGRLYERLASKQEGRVFALAAELVRENIVSKPAISH